MKRFLLSAVALAGLSFATPVLADNHATMTSEAAKSAMQVVLSDERRANDNARDIFRHPAETLAFFDVQPTHTVVEYAPGGGWYTRILAPYVADKGRYIAANYAPNDKVPEYVAKGLVGWPEKFPARASEYTGVPASKISAYFGDAYPAELDGTVDRVLIIRMMHNLMRWGLADGEMMAIHRVLKDDGLVGIVQHWAPDGTGYKSIKDNRGYLKKADVVDFMRIYGFELAGESLVNANPKDPTDWPGGVWTLPPSLRGDAADKSRYEAIGESNRMTLLFRKAQ